MTGASLPAVRELHSRPGGGGSRRQHPTQRSVRLGWLDLAIASTLVVHLPGPGTDSEVTGPGRPGRGDRSARCAVRFGETV